MTTDHGGHSHGHETHGGSRGLGWDLLDSIMLGCAVVIASLLAEQLLKLWRARREQVRYDLTPEGRAAAEAAAAAPAPRTGEGVPMVDLDALAEAVARGDLGDDKQ